MAKIETFKDRTKKSFLVCNPLRTNRSELMAEAQKRFHGEGKKIEIAVGWVYKDALYFEEPNKKARAVVVAYSVKEVF